MTLHLQQGIGCVACFAPHVDIVGEMIHKVFLGVICHGQRTSTSRTRSCGTAPTMRTRWARPCSSTTCCSSRRFGPSPPGLCTRAAVVDQHSHAQQSVPSTQHPFLIQWHNRQSVFCRTDEKVHVGVTGAHRWQDGSEQVDAFAIHQA